MSNLESLVKNWLDDRPTLRANNTPEAVCDLLIGECKELQVVVAQYLQSEVCIQEVEQEVADILIFAITLCVTLGIDFQEAVKTEMAFNYARYPAVVFQSGDYEKTRQFCKRRERQKKLRKDFN